ncbi:hypothetical protein [Nocardia mexicana]|uniref:Uncharacterized protein n=1 Tax=Nocardia mexicana TaxID=279262 RepID=A0A370HK63_9NOCA|nr:hypothetical protein [Nocardia mexicana]RDI55909.1 hypothetical protein DFR68_101746 [Nocardia mexicana]
MILAAFSGRQVVTASDILHPAFDLVECQREYRQAFDVLADATASYAQLKAAAAALVSAQCDIEMLITIIDEVVRERLAQRRNRLDGAPPPPPPMLAPSPNSMPVDGLLLEPLHTESIGEIAARMADLWEAIIAKAQQRNCDEVPEAEQLVELCKGYDYLAAEIESGRRLLPGV